MGMASALLRDFVTMFQASGFCTCYNLFRVKVRALYINALLRSRFYGS